MEVEVRMGKLRNGKAVGKDEIMEGIKKKKKVEVKEWWTGFGGCAIWTLRVVSCQKLEICCNCSTVQD